MRLMVDEPAESWLPPPRVTASGDVARLEWDG